MMISVTSEAMICVITLYLSSVQFVQVSANSKTPNESICDPCEVRYDPGDNMTLTCTSHPTERRYWVDWLTCTGCSRPYNLTGHDELLFLPNTSLEITSSLIANTLKLHAHQTGSHTTALVCYIHGHNNIRGVFLLYGNPQPPGRFITHVLAPQVCPLAENQDLTVSCRAACFNTQKCTEKWTKDGGAEPFSYQSDIHVSQPGTYACADRNNDVIMSISVSTSEVGDAPFESTPFCRYRDKSTAPRARDVNTATSPTPPITTTKITKVRPKTSLFSKQEVTTNGKSSAKPETETHWKYLTDPSLRDPVTYRAMNEAPQSGDNESAGWKLQLGVAFAALGVLVAIVVFIVLGYRRWRRGQNAPNQANHMSGVPENIELMNQPDRVQENAQGRRRIPST